MGRADLHMHTNVSDGIPSVEELLNHISALGTLDVIAITDHDINTASLWAYERRDRYPFDIIPGVEVTSHDGHVLALWVTDPIPATLSLEETVQAIHEAGGLAILAHPFHMHVIETLRGIGRYGNQPELIAEIGFDAVEIHNAATTMFGSNWMAKRRTADLEIAFTGSSDAHTLSGIGSGSTVFEGTSAEDLRTALSNGQTMAEGGWWPVNAYTQYIVGRLSGEAKVTPLEQRARASERR